MRLAKIVILNWNGVEVLPRFLPSVVAATPSRMTVAGEEVGVEIVVADNGSSDGSVELLRRDFPSVRVLELDCNYGFAGGYNRALTALEADGGKANFYILLNSDVETPAGWCEPLLEMLMSRPDVAAVAPKILSYAGRNTLASSQDTSAADGDIRRSVAETFEYAGASGGFIDFLGYPFCRGRILETVERDHGQYDDAREIFWATGACFACRAEVFHAMGGFDETFFAHQEEIDLCWRMQSAGWRVMVEPRSRVWHLGAGTLPPSPHKLYLNYRNNLAMLYKNLPGGAMQTIVAARLVLNSLAAAVYLARGQRKNWSAVWRAHRDFFRMVATITATANPATQNAVPLRESRRTIQSTRIAEPAGVYHRSILVGYLFGKRRFDELKRFQ